MDKRNDCLLSSKDNKFCFHPRVMETRLEPAGDAGRRLQIDRGVQMQQDWLRGQ